MRHYKPKSLKNLFKYTNSQCLVIASFFNKHTSKNKVFYLNLIRLLEKIKLLVQMHIAQA